MQATQQEFTIEQVNHAVDAIINVLGHTRK
jgi:hypothetical protein